MFPPDPNYTELEEEGEGKGGGEGEGKKEGERDGGREGERGGGREGESKKEEKENEGGQKCGYRHKLAVLRPELLETFLQ